MWENSLVQKTNPELVFVGDRLEVRDEASRSRLDRKRWSASGVKSIENCPAMWAVDKLHPEPPDPFGAAELGTSAHKVLEVLYALPRPERTPERAMEILATLEDDFGDEVDFPEGAAELMDWRGQVASKVNGVFKLEDPTSIDVVGTEYKLLNEVGGVPMIGFIDRLDRQSDGSVRAVDYKGLALDTRIPTPDGWKTMAELREGGRIFGSNGKPGNIVGKSEVHHRECFKLSFGATGADPITCDDIHLWNIVAVDPADNAAEFLDEQTAQDIIAIMESGREVYVTRTGILDLPTTDGDVDELHGDAEQRKAALRTSTSVERSLRIKASLGLANEMVRITKVEPIESVPTQCIAVDTPDHTYLVGNRFIPTHNSGKFKTPNRWGDDHGDQIRLYAASLAVDGYDVSGGTLLYIGAGERRDVTLSPNEAQRVVGDFVTTYEEMKESAAQGSYRTKASPLCGWCPLATVCPTAAANNRATPKTERAMLGTTLGIRTEVFTPGAEVVQNETVTPEQPTKTRRKRPMHTWSTTEGTVWEYLNRNNELNPVGSGAAGHCGNASLATELIMGDFNAKLTKKAAGEIVLDVTPPSIGEMEAMAFTLDTICRRAYASLTGGHEYKPGSGLSTRIRGAMRSVIEYTPVPFGGDLAAWEAWVNKMVKRIELVMDNAMKLHIGYDTTTPWSNLAK